MLRELEPATRGVYTGTVGWLGFFSVPGVNQLDDIGLCTLAEPDRFFSYRAMRRRGEADYGRNLSAIALKQN